MLHLCESYINTLLAVITPPRPVGSRLNRSFRKIVIIITFIIMMIVFYRKYCYLYHKFGNDLHTTTPLTPQEMHFQQPPSVILPAGEIKSDHIEMEVVLLLHV